MELNLRLRSDNICNQLHTNYTFPTDTLQEIYVIKVESEIDIGSAFYIIIEKRNYYAD